MASSVVIKQATEDGDYEERCRKFEQMIPNLPKENGWIGRYVVKYQETWFTPNMIKGIFLLQEHFLAQPDDIILATFPKSGTTWLKALIFTIMNRKIYDFSNHPLLSKGPHECIPFLEALVLQNYQFSNETSPSPRLFSTHIPFSLLPESIRSSSCRIVCLLRDPKDVFVSIWHYIQKLRPKELPPIPLDEGFDMFCRGVYQFGPYWDHMLGYFKASLDSPERVLILKFEDMKREPLSYVKKLAEHLGHPFSLEEERDGLVEETVRLCSFENLTNLEVNKTGVHQFTPDITIENHVFFRKGEVRDWKNHLKEDMVKHINQILAEKFKGTDLISYILS